jgi:hypothetical protein
LAGANVPFNATFQQLAAEFRRDNCPAGLHA